MTEILAPAGNEENDGYPALEMIVYGKAPLIFTKHCPLKKIDQCGICISSSYVLKDELQSIKGIEAFRLNFTVESKDQVVKTINKAISKLNGGVDKVAFNKETDTRGHFNKEIL